MNLPTILVSAVVAAVLIAIVAFAIRNRRKGKHTCSCGGDCSHCGHCGH